MTNPALESIAATRRSNALRLIQLEKSRVQRTLADGVIGATGTARPAWQTDELVKLVGDLDARAGRLRELEGDALVAEFASEYLPAQPA